MALVESRSFLALSYLDQGKVKVDFKMVLQLPFGQRMGHISAFGTYSGGSEVCSSQPPAPRSP